MGSIPGPKSSLTYTSCPTLDPIRPSSIHGRIADNMTTHPQLKLPPREPGGSVSVGLYKTPTSLRGSTRAKDEHAQVYYLQSADVDGGVPATTPTSSLAYPQVSKAVGTGQSGDGLHLLSL